MTATPKINSDSIGCGSSEGKGVGEVGLVGSDEDIGTGVGEAVGLGDGIGAGVAFASTMLK